MPLELLQGEPSSKIAFALQEGGKITQVEAKKGLTTLRALAAKGELFFQGKRLLYDPFTIFHVHVEILANEMHPFFVYKADKVPFHEASLILYRAENLFIHRGILRLFSGAFPQMEAFFGEPQSLPESVITSFIENYAEDPPEWGPKVEILLPVKSAPISPELVTTNERIVQFVDDTGAFLEICNSSKADLQLKQDLLEAGFVYKPLHNSSYYCPTHHVREALELLHCAGIKMIASNGDPICFDAPFQERPLYQERGVIVEGEFQGKQQKFALLDALDAVQKGRILLRREGEALFLGQQALNVYKDFPYQAEGQRVCFQRFFAPQIYDRFRDFLMEGWVPYQEVALSPLFIGELFPYQQEGFNWLSFQYSNRFAGLLADEMGLGKTVQTIAFITKHLGDSLGLIVAPETLMSQWEKEIHRFAPTLPVVRFESKISLPERGVLLISYTHLRLWVESLEDVSFGIVVFDEAQLLRNPKTKGFLAATQLKARFLLALSGTPMENHVADLGTLFTLLFPEWAEELKKPSLEQIKRLTKPFTLRRLKKEVLVQLPLKQEKLVYIDLYPEQKEAYQILEKELVAKVRSGEGHVFHLLTALRQQILAPQLVNQEVASAKMDRVLEDLEELLESGQKVLLFSHFARVLALFQERLKEKNFPHYLMDGATKNRDHVVEKFRMHEGGVVFLMTLKTGGVGLNLTEADTVILFEPWWNPQVERQAIDRAHRLGRTNPLAIRRYIAMHTIEERMEKMKKEKESLFTEVLEEETPGLPLLETLVKDLF